MKNTCKNCGLEFEYGIHVGYADDLCGPFCDGQFAAKAELARLTHLCESQQQAIELGRHEYEAVAAENASLLAIRDRPLDDDSNVLLDRCEDREPLSLAEQRELYEWWQEKACIVAVLDEKTCKLSVENGELNAELARLRGIIGTTADGVLLCDVTEFYCPRCGSWTRSFSEHNDDQFCSRWSCVWCGEKVACYSSHDAWLAAQEQSKGESK